jgi:hypothetical protein
MNKLPISALVASCNEGHLLEDCLKSLQFCDEIYFVNLESTDNSIEIATEYVTRIVSFKKVETIEEILPVFIQKLKHDWVLLIDPDERLDPELQKDIKFFFSIIPDDCGKINVPIRYYYKNKALKGTVWGGVRFGRLLMQKSKNEISSSVHIAINLKQGYRKYTIPYNKINVDHHFWVSSFDQMLEKHKRYILKEGEAKYRKGERYNTYRLVKVTIESFYNSFFRHKGYLDGFTGLFLSFFYAWYNWESILSLKKFQKKIQNGTIN